MNEQSIKNLLRYIEENIRITDQTSINYLDSRGDIDRLTLKQNQIIFGRRGSGKSLLLKSLRETKKEFICININLEDYKDISFPNSIIQVHRELIRSLILITKKEQSIFKPSYWTKTRSILKRLENLFNYLETSLGAPDDYEQSVRETTTDSETIEGSAAAPVGGLSRSRKSQDETETTTSIKVSKINTLRNDISDFKNIINETANILGKDIFLIFDDFYFIKKTDQPFLLDYFHRISKNTRLYLKVATIKHRTKTYIQSKDSYIGIELGHDAQSINLDYSLEDFQSLVAFMRQLLTHINSTINEDINYDDLITDNAFRFLCLASGGVPRDFFTLFISLGPLWGKEKSISKPNVIEKAIENMSTKLEAIKKDATDEEGILSEYLQHIKKEIIHDAKWNCFLVSNNEIQNHHQIQQAIKELADLRILHLVNPNISAAHSDGTRYTAYMIDVGLFPNSNPRNFQQVEPGQKDENHREDKIRSAPKLKLNDFEAHINSLNLNKALELTE